MLPEARFEQAKELIDQINEGKSGLEIGNALRAEGFIFLDVHLQIRDKNVIKT